MTNLFSKFKTYLFKNYGENPGKMLIHTGALGWVLSSLGQITAVVFNDKISPEQKSFLIPQEAADAAINIISFYVVTSSIKAFASKLVSAGKLITPTIRKYLQKKGIADDKIGKLHLDIGKFDDVPQEYKSFKNGIEVAASTVGSVLSCNIITPVLRNIYASGRQKEIVAAMNERGQAKPAFQSRLSLADYQKMASAKYSNSLKI